MEASLEQIQAISAELIALYSQKKVGMSDFRGMIADVCEKTGKKTEFSFEFDDMFECSRAKCEKLSINEEFDGKISLENNARTSNIFGNNYLSKDVNSSSSTVIKKEPAVSDRRVSKTKSKSPSPRKPSKEKKRKDSKSRRTKRSKRSRSRSKSHNKSRSLSSSSSRSSSRRKASRNKRKRRDSNENKRYISVLWA